MQLTRRRYLTTVLALTVLTAALLVGPRLAPWAGLAPAAARIPDQTFWTLVTDFSEPSGYFRSDNLLSNETTFQLVIPELRKRTPADGVYIGVGPEQNFTYIAALRPRIAFIVDIRRQNLLLHLMYKAIFEMSNDRAEFLSRLFSRQRPPGLTAGTTARALFEAFAQMQPNEDLYQSNLGEIFDRLTRVHGFGLFSADRPGLTYIYRAFFVGGPDIRYSFPRQYGGRWFPSYADLMMETDADGVNHAFLASEESYRTLRELQLNNRIVPLTGDFAGGKALRAVGDYLREQKQTVSYFYLSNVEQYLFQTEAWQGFFANVAAMPLDERSTFIRAFFNMGVRYPPPDMNAVVQSATLLESMTSAVEAFHSGEIETYGDVINRSR
ncbi:MAG: hypothetical protein IT176_02245 [Acidobacteria bacterium]|nr:hypothetical protein [Acidobacteriota bacterium]